MQDIKKILVTGDKGYIGSVLTKELLRQNYEVKGLDIGYYEKCMLEQVEQDYHTISKDIRDIDKRDLEGIDAIIHLAGLSNDPLGEFDVNLTESINYESTINLARLASQNQIKRLIYASSQSMYGISNTTSELDEDLSNKNPVTAYAKTKWRAECEINNFKSESLTITSFRPSTVFGVSPRMRFDIVFNNLVACAYTTGKIEIKSDGTPWRPVVHVKDVCKAFITGIEAPSEMINGRAFNVGIKNGNYTVRELAEAAQRAVPGSELVFTGEHGSDARTYRVGFKRILSELGEYYKPTWDLNSGAAELVDFFKKIELSEEVFRGEKTNRLKKLKKLIEMGVIDGNMRMILKNT